MSVPNVSTPSFFKRAKTAWPMPLAAPVTSARLPFNPLSGIGGAVDVHRDAGHVRGVVGAQRDDERRGFGHRADAAHRDLRKRTFRTTVFAAQLKNLAEAAAGNHAGSDAIHPHAEFAELERELARQRHDARLGHRVRPARAE